MWGGCSSRGRSDEIPGSSAPPGIACGAGPADEADAPEVVVARRPHPSGEARRLQLVWEVIGKARLKVDEVANRVETRAVHGIAGALALVEHAGEHLYERATQPRSARRPDGDR